MIDTFLTPEMALIIVALIAAIPARWGYKRATKTDEQTEQAGMATQEIVSAGQLMRHYNEIVERYAADIEDLRDRVTNLLELLDKQAAQHQEQSDKLHAEVLGLREKLDTRDDVIEELRTEIASFMNRNGISDGDT